MQVSLEWNLTVGAFAKLWAKSPSLLKELEKLHDCIHTKAANNYRSAPKF
jgi:hypothetical protein